MYVVTQNGIIWYDGIDKKDMNQIPMQTISNELLNLQLTPGTLDCTAGGQLIFDVKSMMGGGQHSIKSFTKTKSMEKYDYALDGEKKVIRFFNNYVLEVKSEKDASLIMPKLYTK